ncbi:MAG TPA: acyl carrier protein [Edaphobacter sp.]|nr:acyl carrier protein [Edaphobacter sp.]
MAERHRLPTITGREYLFSVPSLYTTQGALYVLSNQEKGGIPMDDIAQRCISIIAKAKNIPVDTITLDTTFEELNIDSLDKINISFEVEEAFEIAIPDEALGSLKTVGDVVRGVEQLVAAKAS